MNPFCNKHIMDISPHSHRQFQSRLEPLKSYAWLSAYAVTLAAAVALFGGVFPLAQAVLPVFCAIMLALTPTPARPAPRIVLATIFAPVALTIIWTFIQILPMSAQSGYWPIVQGGAGTLSVSPWQTLNHSMLALGYLAFAWSVYQTSRITPLRLLVVTVAVITTACMYGLYMASTGTEAVLWLEKKAYIGFLTGTFVNKNSFATLAALGVLASLAMALLRVGEISSRLTLRQRFKAFWMLVVIPGWPWLLVAGICFITLVLTGSRAGLAAGAFGTLVLLASLAGTRRAARWPLVIIIGLLVLLFMIVLGAVGQSVGRRMTQLQSDGESRDGIYSLTHQLISENLLTGTGFGTFQQAFSTVRDGTLLRKIPALIEYAHNTYLELATELGLPGILLLTASVMALLTLTLHGISTRRRAVIWPALGLGTLVVVGGHALADFSLSVPAVTLVAITFTMMGIAQAFPEKDKEPQPIAKWQRIGSLAMRAGAVPLCVTALWISAAEYHAFRAEPAIRTMQAGIALRPSEIFPIQRDLQQCLAIRPGHVACREGLAQSYLSLATSYGLTGPQRGVALVYLNMAKLTYTDALREAPLNPWAWYRLARIDAYLGESREASIALANSLLTGPYEPKLAVSRVPLMLSLIPQARTEDAALFGINTAAVWQAQKWQTEAVVRNNPSIWPTFAAMLEAQQAPLPRWLKLP
ncbi:MAG: O-antigen ligase family protein [Blastochloris viridis]|uniref:O-antigen ligase family protein n=1 Tax=Blastochloris viridis TaxID=1079 RepID=A0A6N4RBG0_BLAVI|nr:MAG: O-antigen ligase family protein [Blastochloris viridis]